MEQREKKIYKVTIFGSVVNLVLVVLKFVAGIVGQSAAMVADAIHSLSDLITDFIVLCFSRISSQPQDHDHDYGHGKYETLATAVVGVALCFVGINLGWSACVKIWGAINGEELAEPGYIALFSAIASILLKEIVYHITAKVARDVNSQAVMANAWHHRSDALSSIGAVVGIGGAIMLGPNWYVLDSIAALIVSLFIIRVAFKLLRPCMEELTEASLPDEIEKEIVELVLREDGIGEIHNLRTRKIGPNCAIEMHVRLDGDMTLREAHDKATNIENRLRERFGCCTHIGLHLEPFKE